jgi:hypothetical protein
MIPLLPCHDSSKIHSGLVRLIPRRQGLTWIRPGAGFLARRGKLSSPINLRPSVIPGRDFGPLYPGHLTLRPRSVVTEPIHLGNDSRGGLGEPQSLTPIPTIPLPR